MGNVGELPAQIRIQLLKMEMRVTQMKISLLCFKNNRYDEENSLEKRMKQKTSKVQLSQSSIVSSSILVLSIVVRHSLYEFMCHLFNLVI